MRTIKLRFTEERFLQKLSKDAKFMTEIAYLNPDILDNFNILLTDSSEYHNAVDTEDVILTTFASAIKRIFFSKSICTVGFIHALNGRPKGGLQHDGLIIIDSIKINEVPL